MQHHKVEPLRKGHRDLDMAYQLIQAFVTMLTERREPSLHDWLVQAERSDIVELKSFAQGIRRD